MAFCRGCGRNSLRMLSTELGGRYESPCTFYEGKSRYYLIEELTRLSTDELNQVLEFYGYEKESG